MKYLSLFTGIGGFELGIGKEHECVGYSEIDKYAVQVYQHHFPEHINYGDITKINAEELPDFDLLVGGFPCQAFSIAGKRKGFDDTRGTLFFDIARILRAKRPRLLLLENVKGLLSHDNGNTFKTIISTLDELGYDLQWQVLNSKNHGVPQNRERVFIVGHSRGTPRPEVFPFGTNDCETINVQGHVTNTLTARYYGAEATGTYIEESELNAQIQQLNNPTHSNDRVYGTDGLSPTLTLVALTERRTEEAKRLRRMGVVKDTRSLKELAPREDGIANTVTTGDVKNQSLTDGYNIRRLTPLECERLQGFPDNWTAVGTNGKISDTQRYKMCGNAVTVNVIKDIIERLCKAKPTHS